MSDSLPYHQRPNDHTPVHTEDLPDTPIRDRAIPATAWVEAPEELLHLGDDLHDRPVTSHKRRIGPWLLWRSGPARKAAARYWAARAVVLSAFWTFTLTSDGDGEAFSPPGVVHERIPEEPITVGKGK